MHRLKYTGLKRIARQHFTLIILAQERVFIKYFALKLAVITQILLLFHGNLYGKFQPIIIRKILNFVIKYQCAHTILW